MSSLEENNLLTVQGRDTPVPAPLGSEQAGSQASSSSDRSAAGVGHSAPVASNATSDGSIEEREEEATKAFNLLSEKIRSLVDLVLPRNNIHKEIKILARAVSRTLGEYTKLCHLNPATDGTPAAKRKDGGCETSPIFRQGVPHNIGEHEPPSPPRPLEAKKTKVEGEMQAQSKAPDWTIVVKKGKKKKTTGKQLQQQQQQQKEVGKPAKGTSKPKAGMRPPRPDAIKIKASSGGSYADILRKIKAAPDLQCLGDRVTHIRRTRAGELLLETGRPGAETSGLKTVVSATLSGSAEVQLLTHRETITIRDMDETTTSSEIAAAIAPKIGPNVVPPDIIKIRGSYSGTLAATIQLPAAAAKKLLQDGRIKIGWVNCRVRLREGPSRCYRCHESGHIARDCKSSVDRSAQCYRCGQEGHKAVNCVAAIKAQEVGVSIRNG